DPAVLQPQLRGTSDSDGFARTDILARRTTRNGPNAFEVVAGGRRVEGHDLEGAMAAGDGAVVEAAVARWAREGTLRFEATVGAEVSERMGTRPILGISLAAREMAGWNLGLEVRSAPGHALASTFESLDAGLRTDRVLFDAYR